MIELSVVIVTWNCKQYLEEFFESAGELLQSPSTQVIVVDNASTDGSPDFIATRYPRVQVIRKQTNLGFAKANNVGLAAAKGEFICLINPDVKLLPGCFERVMQTMRTQQDIGLLGPQMLGRDGLVHRSTMRFPTVWNCLCQALALDVSFAGRLFKGQLMRDFKHDETREVDVLNGWFWMTRRRALEEVGHLDERFFMYGEDIDFCKRFHDRGWKRVYLADARAVHYGGGSSSNAPVRFYIEQQRANLQYFRKHHGVVKQYGFVMSVWIYHLVRILGHSLKYVLSKDSRREVGLKIQRSATCVRWLLGMPTGIEGVS
jgi:GT2 family glycosyltransferase